jgi:hypothetical protein
MKPPFPDLFDADPTPSADAQQSSATDPFVDALADVADRMDALATSLRLLAVELRAQERRP